MFSKTALLFCFLALTTAFPLETRASCSGAHILWARGSYENYTNSTLLPLINYIQFATAGSSSAIIYDATIVATPESASNQQSVAQGVNNTILQIKQYVAQCGSASRIVLAGYSQGGQVMTDTLVGGAFEPNGIDSSYRKYSQLQTMRSDPWLTLAQSQQSWSLEIQRSQSHQTMQLAMPRPVEFIRGSAPIQQRLPLITTLRTHYAAIALHKIRSAQVSNIPMLVHISPKCVITSLKRRPLC